MAKLGPVARKIAEDARAAGLPVPARASIQGALPLADAEALSLALAIRPGDRAAAVDEVRRRGRPKGSRNRRSEDLIRYLGGRYAHPLEILMQVASRPTDVLAAELGCKRVEALAIQKSAAVEALPYFESKKPVAVQVDSRVIQLVIHEHAAASDAAVSIDGERVTLTMENQGVSE